MEFSLFLFLSIAVILLVESRLSAKWSSLYFKTGFQLYGRTASVESSEGIDNVSLILNKSFKGKGYWPTINFYQIDNQTIAFREKLFEFALFNYTPIMHGKIEKNNNRFKVVGYANWFPIGFCFLWYSSLIPSFKYQMDITFLVAPVLIFGAIYVMQAKRYSKVARQLAEN